MDTAELEAAVNERKQALQAAEVKAEQAAVLGKEVDDIRGEVRRFTVRRERSPLSATGTSRRRKSPTISASDA